MDVTRFELVLVCDTIEDVSTLEHYLANPDEFPTKDGGVILIPCSAPNCSNRHWAYKREIRRQEKNFGNDTKRGKTCGRTCGAIVANSRRGNTRFKVDCAWCGKKVELTPGRAAKSKSGMHFCNRECQAAGMALNSGLEIRRPSHWGTASGSKRSAKKHRAIAFEHYPQECNRCGWDEVPEVLVVHHRDYEKSNNAPENLEVLCNNCHALEHL